MYALISQNNDTPLLLPWPPSTNTLWRHYGKQVLISKKYRDYKILIKKHALLWRRKLITSKISIEIKAYPPDKRKRDLDNTIKATLDSLQFANIFEDDSQIEKLSIERMDVKKGGELEIFIKEYL